MPGARLCRIGLFLLGLAATGSRAAPPPEAYALRNLGSAQLENERPAEAEATYRKLVAAAPRDPLGHANLAIALLRQQKFDEALASIDAALALAPKRADLVAIRGEVLMWKGDRDAALVELRAAAETAPDDLEILYRLYRHASSMRTPDAQAATAFALDRLAKLRPENLFVLLRVGQAAIESGDRTRASGAYLRIRELVWQALPAAQTAVASVIDALEAGDLEAARRPAILVQNVMLVTPMFQGGLKELTTGVQGVAVSRFTDEPPPTTFGRPVPIELRVSKIEGAAAGTSALITADLDGDDQPDTARLLAGPPRALEIRLASDGLAKAITMPAPAAAESLLALDLDNDGARDLLAAGGGLALWRGDGKGGFRDESAAFGLAGRRDARVLAFDYDQEGDLDLATASDAGRLDLLRNALAGPLEAVGERALPPLRSAQCARCARATSIATATPTWWRSTSAAFWCSTTCVRAASSIAPPSTAWRRRPRGAAMTIADLDDDGWPELVIAGPGLTVLRNQRGVFEPWSDRGRPSGRGARVRRRCSPSTPTTTAGSISPPAAPRVSSS